MFFTPGGGREFRDATINSHFGICLRKTRPSLGKSHYYPFAKCFPSTEKRRKAGVFKFLWFEDRFRKTRLPQRVSKNTFLKRVSYCAQQAKTVKMKKKLRFCISAAQSGRDHTVSASVKSSFSFTFQTQDFDCSISQQSPGY